MFTESGLVPKGSVAVEFQVLSLTELRSLVCENEWRLCSHSAEDMHYKATEKAILKYFWAS